MLRFWVCASALAVTAMGAVACSGISGEKTASDTANATTTIPLHCEGPAGIASLKLVTKDVALAGIAGGRAYLRAAVACESRKLDGTDAKPCPAPDAKTVAHTLIGRDAEYLYFQGDREAEKTLFRTKIADGTSKSLHAGDVVDHARLAGDTLLWLDGDGTLWSMPKAGGDAKKLATKTTLFDTHGADLLTAGEDGVAVKPSTDGFHTVGDATAIALAPRESASISEVVIGEKTITLLMTSQLWSVDRATSTSKKLLDVPAGITTRDLSTDGESVALRVDDARDASKPVFAYARLVNDKLAALVASNHAIGPVVHDEGLVVWSVEERDHSMKYFAVPEAQYGKKAIQCTDQPLSAPVKDAGTKPATDAGTKDASTSKPAKDAGSSAKDAGPFVSGDDDDDIATESDPTEPSSEDDGEHPTTVLINPACQSAPGTARSSFGLVVALAALGLRRRRRR